MLTISTAGSSEESPLGRLRTRALASPKVEHVGAHTVAEGPTLKMLEWAAPEGADADDPATARACNPASWLTTEALAEQRL